MMIRMFMTIMGALLILSSVLSQPAAAQGACATRQAVTDKLKNNYDEKATAIGLAHNGTIVEVFTSQGGGNSAAA